MYKKYSLIIVFLAVNIVFILNAAPKRNIYITLDTSGSMYGDKYMISNYTAQLIALLCSNDNVYFICNGIAKNISGDLQSYKQIQFNYASIRQKWGVSPLGTQIGDIVSFNNLYRNNYSSEQWLFIIGDGNWESHKFPKVLEKFSSIVKEGNISVFFIPYGNVADGQSDFIDYLKTLKTPRVLNGSRELPSVISNCVIIFSYLTGNSGKNIQISLINAKTVKITSALPVNKYVLFYQDETDELLMPTPISAMQDTANFSLKLLGTPTTSKLRYKDNQTLLSGALWEINADKPIEADVPLSLIFNKNIQLKKLRLFPYYDLGLNSKLTLLQTKSMTVSNLPRLNTELPIRNDEKTSNNNDSVFISKIHTSHKPHKIEPAKTLSETKKTNINLIKIKNSDSINVYKATVKLTENIDTNYYKVEISHSKPLLFKRITTKIDSNHITLTVEMRGKIAENFVPDTLALKAKLIPKITWDTTPKTLQPKVYEINANTHRSGEKSPRTSNIQKLFFFILGLVLYLIALTGKARFKKDALLECSSLGKTNEIYLRKQGIKNWLNRWFNPFGSENREIIFYQFQKPIIFVAKQTKYSISIVENTLDNNTMHYNLYSPTKNNMIEFVENRELIIESSNNESLSVQYNSTPQVKDDRVLFKYSLWTIALFFVILFVLL